jgi:hypothetical protein
VMVGGVLVILGVAVGFTNYLVGAAFAPARMVPAAHRITRGVSPRAESVPAGGRVADGDLRRDCGGRAADGAARGQRSVFTRFTSASSSLPTSSSGF